ncbi:ParB/RepB/Spo0J family partition protein [Nonomuraea thailandensis]
MSASMPAIVSQTYRMVPVADLEPHPDNPHQGDVDVIAKSIEKNGFYGTILVQKSRMRIIAGEHRWRGAKAKGLGQVPALILDVDDAAALRILLADNRTAEIGGYDDQALAELLRSLDDLDGTGWTEQDLDDLADAIAADNAVALSPTALRLRAVAAPTRLAPTTRRSCPNRATPRPIRGPSSGAWWSPATAKRSRCSSSTSSPVRAGAPAP